MKKVLLIADSNMSLSGVPVVYMSIVRNFSKKIRFDIIIFNDNDMHFQEEFLSFGGKIFYFDCQKPTPLFKKILWILFKYNHEAKKFIRTRINLKGYNAIHCFRESLSYPFLREAEKANIETRILHFNSASSAYKNSFSLKSLPFDFYRKRSINCCTDLIFVSEDSMKHTASNHNVKKHVIYNTYDLISNDLIYNDSNNLHLIQIGTFSSRKNQYFSLMVLKELLLKYPLAKLYFIGKELERGYLDKMKIFINTNHLENNVVFLPPNTEKKRIFADSSYLIFPSLKESFGLVLLEAQSCGLHCFSSNTIPTDADMGNVTFMELIPKKWADSIGNYFMANKNKRKIPINIDRFSTTAFIKNLENIYK